MLEGHGWWVTEGGGSRGSVGFGHLSPCSGIAVAVKPSLRSGL